jgi:cell wall-associated NlpC family hydrolase
MADLKLVLVRFFFLSAATLFFTASSFASSGKAIYTSPDPDYEYSRNSAELAMHAMSIVDTDYKFGGNGRGDGFDCSGLVRYVFRNVWGAELPRTSAQISEVGMKIRVAELQPGDLVFYNTRKRRFSHVGIYLGGNKFVHAPSRGGKVRVEDMSSRYWQVRFNGARRIADPQKEKMQAARARHSFFDDTSRKTLVRSN